MHIYESGENEDSHSFSLLFSFQSFKWENKYPNQQTGIYSDGPPGPDRNIVFFAPPNAALYLTFGEDGL